MTDPLPNRPPFKLPFPAGAVVTIKTYKGHNPDDKKMDMYRDGWPTGSPILASAAGVVHEHFDPGGLEINHGDGWFTTYMHMDERAPVGTHVGQGDWVGRMGSVGTGYPHLHHEQLYAGPGAIDGDTSNMVNPIIEGHGPLVLVPGQDIRLTSTNDPAAEVPPPPPPAPVQPSTRPPTPITPPATPTPKGQKMLKLVQFVAGVNNTNAVYLSDMMSLRWIQDSGRLARIQAELTAAGQNAEVQRVAGPRGVYGVLIGKDPEVGP